MKAQKERKISVFLKVLMLTCFLVLEVCFVSQSTLKVHAQGTATVTAESGKIRASADTSSDVLASVKKNDKLDVIAQCTSSDGYTWYKVYVDGTQKGYIRADLVSDVSGTVPTESSSTSESTNKTETTGNENAGTGETVTVGSGNRTTTSSQTEETPQVAPIIVNVNPSTVVAAKVTGSSVRVRESASTSGKVAGNAQAGTEVSVSGEAVDEEGKTWYQVSFNSGDKTINGFIRSDFLEVTQTVEPETETVEETVEEQEPEEPVNNDYELHYEADEEGVEEWFLYDNVKGTKRSLSDILEAVAANQEEEENANSQLQKMKIILIVMAALILVLVIGVTVLLFKVKDSYDYDEEEDDEEQEEPVRKRTTQSFRQRRREFYADEDDEEDEDEDEDDEDDEDEDEEPVVRSRKTSGREPVKKPQGEEWQSKNFLDVDDDMEFEFLDLK